jgi:hypothetical protein
VQVALSRAVRLGVLKKEVATNYTCDVATLAQPWDETWAFPTPQGSIMIDMSLKRVLLVYTNPCTIRMASRSHGSSARSLT